jgi:hypothetical protein
MVLLSVMGVGQRPLKLGARFSTKAAAAPL